MLNQGIIQTSQSYNSLEFQIHSSSLPSITLDARAPKCRFLFSMRSVLHPRTIFPLATAAAAGFISAFLANRAYNSRARSRDRLERPRAPKMNGTHPITMKGLPPFQMTFAVPMHCQSCVDDLTAAVSKVEGANSPSPSVHRTSKLPPPFHHFPPITTPSHEP